MKNEKKNRKNKQMKQFIIALCLIISSTTSALALPSALSEDYPDLQKVGKSNYYYFIVHVYDIDLYQAAKAPDIQALEIKYQRDISSVRRVEKALEDLEDQGKYDAKTMNAWKDKMTEIFPNVKDGDTITIFQNESQGTEFYHNENYRGEISDPQFTDAFIGIWLGEKPASSKMKHQLLEKAFHF